MPPGSSKSSRRYLRPLSTLHQTQNFKGARSVTFGDHTNFSRVRGDQNVYVTAEGKKKKFVNGTEDKEAEYAEFREIKRGDIVAVETVYRGAIWRYNREQRKVVKCSENTVIAGEATFEGVSLKCMVVSYSGEGAEERWKSDFRQFGGVRHAENAQLVAINRSSIPMHVIRGDLVPIAHLWDQVGDIGHHYLAALAFQMHPWGNVWLDTSRGVFYRGPEGPSLGVTGVWKVEDLPLDAELLREDVMIRYLISRKLDREALEALSSPAYPASLQVKVGRPTVISTWTNTILAVGNGVWKAAGLTYLGERAELPDGTTRFTLHPNRNRCNQWRGQCHLRLNFNGDIQSAWIAQATSVFHAHGVPLQGDLREYKLITPNRLRGNLSQSKAQRRRRERHPPIYLFIPPFFSTSTFWSFDLNGQIPIPKDLCRYLGLSVRLRPEYWEYSWEASTYQRLHNYQVARGFDPTTTDFARHLGYRIFDIVDKPFPSRFEELDDFSLEILFGDTQPVHEALPVPLDLSGISTNNIVVPTQANTAEAEDQGTGNILARMNVWSSLLPTFSWAAMEDSDIHSAGF